MIENILYINLTHRADRRNKMNQQLSRYSIPIHRIEAIYGIELQDPEYNTHVMKSLDLPEVSVDYWKSKKNFALIDYRITSILPRVGCFLSHYRALKYIVENKLNNVLILEDDAELLPSFSLNVETPPDSFVTYLGYSIPKNITYELKNHYEKIDFDRMKIYGAYAYYIHTWENCKLIVNLMKSVFKDGKGRDKGEDLLTGNHRIRARSYDLWLRNLFHRYSICYMKKNPTITHSSQGSDISSVYTNKMKFNL